MSIVVNARFLSQSFTGVQKYAWRWSKFLKDNYPEILFVRPKKCEQIEYSDYLGAIEVGFSDGPFWEQTELPLWLHRNNKPTLINFGNTAPVSYANQIITIHDLATIVHPEWFSSRFSKYYQWMIPKIIRNSKKIITVSEFSANQIIAYFKIKPENIKVIYNTCEIPDKPVFNIKQNFVLAVGSISHRKNYALILDLWDKKSNDWPQLWIRGDKDSIFNSDKDVIERVIHNPKIKWIEPIREEAMISLYQNAKMLLNPSLYEGFGLPNLEAMANGCPLIISDIEVFREVCDNVAYYEDPFSPELWEKRIEYLLNQPPDSEWTMNAYNRAKKFSNEVQKSSMCELISQILKES